MNPQIQISSIEIIPISPRDGLVGFASLTYNGELRLNNLGVHTDLSNKGFRITYPQQTIPTGKKIYVFHPLTKSVGDVITSAVSREFQRIIDKNLGNKSEEA